MPRQIKPINLAEVKYIAHTLAKKTMSWQEPIPEFDTRYPHILESCLTQPFQKFGNKLLYPGLSQKAAVLFYLMIKNHPFQNGNKRIAVTTLLLLLYRNKKWLKTNSQTLYNTARWVAASPPGAKDQVISYLDKFISKQLKTIKS